MIAKYYKTQPEIVAFSDRIKITKCPNCGTTGYLILHGFLKGINEKNPNRRIRRGKRYYCSNRDQRKGCGKTFSVLNSFFIKSFTTTAVTLWIFLTAILSGLSIFKAQEKITTPHSCQTFYKIWNRFRQKQSHIRTCIYPKIKEQTLSSNLRDSPLETIQHLKSIFGSHKEPIMAFQHQLQASII
jgi:hypothetical protein